ncbi:putative cysteinyl-tRNA synthetase [Glarea lozoyensis 74030]|uniref:Putative cysteinyl-tRNA synthetase n=1 Tax=Glarea lozoyensis (strain ATCC 74030 / MF5533) TaxID=1104152 RepID=H0EU67_GLAL7|nr:putative cysteinyl-tRNA synthetase [Glarea lozoyensis 74030]
MKMHLSNLTAAAAAIQEEKVFGGADEILLPYLDSLYKDSIDGADHTIFTDVTKYWEDDFMGDMDALNVMRPDTITRVTAYVPQIAKFVEQLVAKGFAYEAEGSVYFDIAAFEAAGNPYARLRPESRNDKALQEDGEGSLSKSLGGKRGPGDFALWKKSKPGEPVWDSVWGGGRPGWHIECSVMASDVLGSQMDIHSGGIDLAFPHHDNELAQSEAYFYSETQEGLYANLAKARDAMESALNDSFDTPKAMQVLYGLIKEANIHVNTHKANVDVPGLEAIARWVTKMVGIFGLDSAAAPPYDGLGWTSTAFTGELTPLEIAEPFHTMLERVRDEIERLDIHSPALDAILATKVDTEFETLTSSGTRDPEALVMPYLRVVAKARDEIRKLAPTSPVKKEILALSDRIRDEELTNLGVYLDDRSDQGALIKFVSKEELLAQREEKAAKEKEKLAQKEAAKLAREKLEAEKAEKAKVSPLDMFRDDRYSEWDEEGIPTRTSDGKEVPKSGIKKMKKDWERQKKAHEEWKAKSQA